MKERQARARGSWLAGRCRSFRYAWNGLVWMVRHQPNAQIHLAATVCAIALGAWLRITPGEWCAVGVVIGMVWSAEGFNSALEILADHLAPDEHPMVGRAKDVAAGAVLFAAISAAVIGVVIFGPRLFALFQALS